MALTHFCCYACYAAHSGPIFLMAFFAMDMGLPKMAAATLLLGLSPIILGLVIASPSSRWRLGDLSNRLRVALNLCGRFFRVCLIQATLLNVPQYR